MGISLTLAAAENSAYRGGLAAFAAGRLDEAQTLFTAVVRAQPRHVGALNLLGIVLTQAGRFAEAEAYLQRALVENASSETTLYNYGLVLKALNRPAEALERFTQALSLNSGVAETWNNRGTALNDLKRHDEAVEDFERAIGLNAGYAEAYANKGKALTVLRRFDEAAGAFDAALSLKHDLAEGWVGRGNLNYERGRFAEAAMAHERAVSLKPDLAEAWLGRASAAGELKRYEEAHAAYERALALKPELAEAWLGRGIVSHKEGRYEEALAAYDRALGLEADLVLAWLARGNTFSELKRDREAEAAYDRALELDGELAEAWLGRGNLAFERRHYEGALDAYGKALALRPDLAEAWSGRGNAALELRRQPDALAAFDKAIAIKPELAEAWLGRGIILRAIDRRDEALVAYDRALTLKPDSAEAWQGHGSVLLETGRVSEALASFDKAVALKPDYADALSNRIFALDFADAGFAEQQAARRLWWENIGAAVAQSASARHSNSRDPHRRIKVGYVSADLRGHSAAYCFRPMLQHHDKDAFEITCYSCSPLEDEVTADCRRAADRWRNVAQASDEELRAQIISDGIDILVDLSGHTAGHRLAVFARKPSPVQVSAGATGTGLPVIDYLFSDPVACPASVRHLFAEKVYDLPSIMTIEPVPPGLEVSAAPVLARGHITFGVFNRAGKITDEAVALWSRILHAVAGSRLLLKDTAFDEAALRGRQLKRFAEHRIAEDRIAFLGRTPRPEHLAAFKEVDISLDPFPQNGGISALESMQMGVPVIALLGEGVSSRAAGAILSSIGMNDWVAKTIEDYLAIAQKFATMPEHLAALRIALPQRIATSAVGNAAIYTKAIENAYRTMWAKYCRGSNALTN